MSPMSPTLSLRDVQNKSTSFPMTDIENANDIAQELSNLQALRRMSMDVGNTTDPDLLPFQGMSLMAMPPIAPKGNDDEADPSRLLWVPARVHPELAPMEFKSFLENRVQSMKRRSESSTLSVDSLQRSGSGGLRRKKSMLSRQIDNGAAKGGDDYVDGAERLERQRSLNGQHLPEVTLDELVKDPTKAVQKLAQETQRQMEEPGADKGSLEDMPILPVPPGMGLRRSTRTTYRKGGSLKGERLPFSKRIAAARQAEAENEETGAASPIDAPPRQLARVQTEPIPENFSRPKRSVRRREPFLRENASPTSASESPYESPDSATPTSAPAHDQLPIRTSSVDPSRAPIPQIVEPPAVEDEYEDDPEQATQPTQPARPFPARSSSQKAAAQILAQREEQVQQPAPTIEEPPPRSNRRPVPGRSTPVPVPPIQTQQLSQSPQAPQPSHQVASPVQKVASPVQVQTLNDIAQHPMPLPGSGSTRTDSLTLIPTFPADDRKFDRKGKKDRDDAESISSTKSTSSWKWFNRGGGDEKKRKEEESKKKGKSFAEKAQDNTRLDVLQTSIDTAIQKGRESLLLDRESIDNKLQEERKKESTRKAGDTKKEKDGLFASIFGGKGRKGDKESGKKYQRSHSPDPPTRLLRPDIDYPWTRFTLLEERAIYRMAHIKLANPRRPLYSQVLLSNFMYAYLAKIQAMHPQIQVPQSPQQKRLEEERRRKEQEEQQYLQQQMLQQQQVQDSDRYNFEYHRVSLQLMGHVPENPASPVSSNTSLQGDQNMYGSPSNEGVTYVEDSQYDYDQGIDEMPGHDQHSQQMDHRLDGYSRQGGSDYYNYGIAHGGSVVGGQDQYHKGGREHDDDMW